MNGATLNVEMIKWAYPLLNKYFGFEYIDIDEEIQSALFKYADFEYQKTYLTTGNIDHLPDDFTIFFPTDNFHEIIHIINSYEFSCDTIFGVTLMLLCFYSHNKRKHFYNVEAGTEMYEIVREDKSKLYEFLLDNYKSYDANNPLKAQITILYGLNSQVTINNDDNWLYNQLKEALYKDLTYEGRCEYERGKEPQKPRRAPSFSNFVAYNTYLLLMAVVGSDKRYPVEFLKFIIDFCESCKVELIERQQTTIGMKEFLSHATQQYQNEPMPFSIVR